MEETRLFSDDDIAFLAKSGISEEEAIRQYHLLTHEAFRPSMVTPAVLRDGVMCVSGAEQPYFLNLWEQYRESEEASIVKFVPASGAASRMFADLFPLLEAEEPLREEELTPRQQLFFKQIDCYPFIKELNEACLRSVWATVSRLIASGRYRTVIQLLLTEKGLGYASLPKGLVPFHRYAQHQSRTAAMEHLAEGAYIAKNVYGRVKVHFTVPSEKHDYFVSHLEHRKEELEDYFGVVFDLSYSVQSPSTDTLSLDSEGNLFRKQDGTLLLRPGGHGALLQNLQALEADVAIIKNIDNVSPDHLKGATIAYTKLLGGVLLDARKKAFSYIERIESGRSLSHSLVEEMLAFLKKTFCIHLSYSNLGGEKELIDRIYHKLNRPMRVCGMIHNEGEPGGGPFVVKEPDGSTSLQIMEASQFGDDEDAQKLFRSSTYFNPVLIVCSLRNHLGASYSLHDYVNPQMVFRTQKSYEGRTLTALEHPGLWNGAMDRWNTIFVEVPKEVFTPVKSVYDLVRPYHCTQP